jgi:3-deoxy-D-manno-octulosonic acid kinase
MLPLSRIVVVATMLEPPRGFEWARQGRIVMLIRSDVRSWVEPALRAPASGAPADPMRRLDGGRGGAEVIAVAGHEMVLRAFRRGGLPARVLHDTYCGWSPRPFRELCVTEALRARGAPVVDVYGACVQWLFWGCYKGWIATRYIRSARTLWQWIAAAPPAAERTLVLQAVGKAIRRLHDSGGTHPDLNLNNILIQPTDAARGFEVLLIDFDRAPVARRFHRQADADLTRLRRSARKLDPHGRWVTVADLQCLETAYHEVSG